MINISLVYDENTQSVGFKSDKPLSATLAIAIMSTIITDLAKQMTAKVSQPGITHENVRLLQKLQGN